MTSSLKQQLHIHHRSLRTHPGKLLLGSTGARLWADSLDPAPGFRGTIDFIHKANLPLLFTVEVSGKNPLMEPIKADWYPDELVQRYTSPTYIFHERKLITWDDVAVSCQSWQNRGHSDLFLRLTLPDGALLDSPSPLLMAAHDLRLVTHTTSTAEWIHGQLRLSPDAEVTFLLLSAVALEGEGVTQARLERVLSLGHTPEEIMDALCGEYMQWFSHAPVFTCSDQLMERCWWYRFYILRKNLAKPGTGFLPYHVFYEGRSHRMKKTPYTPSGWEFSRLIPLSTPLTMADAQWLHGIDGVLQDSFRSLAESINDDGVFSVTSVDSRTKEYANYAAWALYQYYLVSGDQALINELLPAFKQHVRNVRRLHRSGLDSLQVCTVHALTGKEYQPSYWYFAAGGYPSQVRGAKEGYTPLRRVDCSVYLYLNALALCRLGEAVDDPESASFASLAEQVRRDILDKMWDEDSGFFYDLHCSEEKKALVKNIVGVYPLWAEITEDKHLKALRVLTDPALFARGSGFASAATDCPVYSPSGGWMGNYFKGRDGCLWNGPSWPYTTGIALDTLAKQSKAHGHRFDTAFERFLHEYTLEHFHQGNVDAPYLVEFYNSESGEPLSDEPDYNHSFYADLIVRHVAGIQPTEKGFTFCPLSLSLEYFSLTGIQLRGHCVDVYYRKEEGLCGAAELQGYTLKVDGKTVLRGWNNVDEPVHIRLENNHSEEE